MILGILTLLTSIILVLIQLYIITNKPSKVYYIPTVVFIISTISYLYILFKGEHFITMDESVFLVRIIQMVVEFLIINSITFLLYFITKKPKYKYHLLCFFIVIISVILFSIIDKTDTKSDSYTNNMFVAENIYDTIPIIDSINACYLESEYYAGYNSYPLTLKPNLRIMHDVLNLSNMGYYNLNDKDTKTISIALNDVEATTFYDEYLYYKSMVLLGVNSDFGLEQFLKKHYNESSGLFFGDKQDESLMEQLTATMYCIELYDLANISIPHEDKIKSRLFELLNDNTLFMNPKSIENCYEMILKEPGTILRILSFLNKSENIRNEVSQRKEWFENIANSVFNEEHSCSQIELWVKGDILEINKNLYHLNLENNTILKHNCLLQFTENTTIFETEDFFHDSQYIYDFARLNYLSGNSPKSTEFVASYIKSNIDTYFRQQYRSTVLAQDTFYGVSVANQFNVSIDVEKIINSALVWIDEFINNNDSNIELNSQTLYAVKILKLLDYNMSGEDFKKLQDSISTKLDNNKFITPDYKERYLLLHELTLLYELKSEISPHDNPNTNNNLPEWIIDIMAEDLSTDNLNIAYDLVKLIDIDDPLNAEFLGRLDKTLDKKINSILKVINDEKSDELLDEILRINNIMEKMGVSQAKINKFLNAIDLTSININNLSVAFNIMSIQGTVAK